MIMINLSYKFKYLNSGWAVSIALLLSIFIFSGFQSNKFQNSREDSQIESQFDAPSISKVKTFLFTGFNSGLSIDCLDIVTAYSLLQLFEFNSRLNSYFIRIANTESPAEANLFFIAKTIPLCSDEDSHLNLKG